MVRLHLPQEAVYDVRDVVPVQLFVEVVHRFTEGVTKVLEHGSRGFLSQESERWARGRPGLLKVAPGFALTKQEAPSPSWPEASRWSKGPGMKGPVVEPG